MHTRPAGNSLSGQRINFIASPPVLCKALLGGSDTRFARGLFCADKTPTRLLPGNFAR